MHEFCRFIDEVTNIHSRDLTCKEDYDIIIIVEETRQKGNVFLKYMKKTVAFLC